MNQGKQTTTLMVDGMTCPSCARHVDTALRRLEGVEAVEVRVRERRVSVVHAGQDTEAFIEALAEAGYPARAA
jgi:copper chaperone